MVGVFRDIPTSHFKADIFYSYATAIKSAGPIIDKGGELDIVYQYVKLKPKTSAEEFTQRFNKLFLAGVKDPDKNSTTVHLRPLLDIHLKSDVLDELLPDTGNYFLIMILLLVAILILITAWINFINLSTSKSIERSRETGIRKVNGATRGPFGLFSF